MINPEPTKTSSWVIALFLVVMAIFWAISAQQHSEQEYQGTDEKEFSQARALEHLRVISAEPHYVGSPAHTTVREYLQAELEKLGLEVETFEHLATARNRLVAANTKNLVARIKGSTDNKALALMSHYDSRSHASLGASDAGSGIVTILEGVRTFLANGKQPENDIVIVITDAEEQGLLGANAFVKYHPWAKDIGLVLNFEARGSGGPSFMLIETNGGNKNFIRSFDAAGIDIPVANSLMYGIYKKLPNDTDLTVFREQADIDGFLFAFIDDHFDYHTRQDSFERLDLESLNHQADYLMATLNHYAFADLGQLKSDEDWVYFNFPGLDMVAFPYAWVPPLVIIAALLLVLITGLGLKRKSLSATGILVGFVPLLAALLVAGGIGYFGWPMLLLVFPQYGDLPHGFTYNGHWLIAFFVSLACATTLLIYRLFTQKFSGRDLFFAPITLWLMINIVIALSLPGAGFLSIPLLLALACFGLMAFAPLTKSNRVILITLLTLPSLMLLAPLIPVFVVALGLKMAVIATLLTCLALVLLVPALGNYPGGYRLAGAMGLIALVCLVIAAMQSDYSTERNRPNSLNYIHDLDSGRAFMVSYDRTLDEFTRQFFDQGSNAEPWDPSIYPQQYLSKVRRAEPVEPFKLPAANVEVLKNERTGSTREISILITPQRPNSIIQLASEDDFRIERISVNGQAFTRGAENFSKDVGPGFFFKYVVSSPDETVQVEMTVAGDAELSLKLFETSFDLFEQVEAIQPRSELYMPAPFVITDAVILGQSIEFEKR